MRYVLACQYIRLATDAGEHTRMQLFDVSFLKDPRNYPHEQYID